MKKPTKKDIQFKYVPLHTIHPYENNSKVHTVTQLEGISESIKRFGFKQPIVIDKQNVIVAGHGRYEAAAALGYEELPCIIADDLTDDEIKAYRILDNKLAEGATDIMKLELELSLFQFDFTPFKVDISPRPIDLSHDEDKPIKDQTEFTVLISCNNENEQQKIYEEMQQRGFECKLIM
jgi:ParB family chromosome partitioning protein